MTSSLLQMITCRWSARRIQRYLDADPSAALTPGEVSRIEAHLSMCERCTQTAAEHRALHAALTRLWGAEATDADSTSRLRSFLDGLSREDAARPEPERPS